MPGTFYVAHEPRGKSIDLDLLRNFARQSGADVRFVFSENFFVSQHPQEAMATAETFAADFNFATDRLVLAGGDPLAGMICAIALTHQAIEGGFVSFGSLRYTRGKDAQGQRTIPKYVAIDIPTGVR